MTIPLFERLDNQPVRRRETLLVVQEQQPGMRI
jgi:hypothetical protein